ncbi:MAG: hypothetical protein AAF743_02390 [Planctomycetota bacterium]
MPDAKVIEAIRDELRSHLHWLEAHFPVLPDDEGDAQAVYTLRRYIGDSMAILEDDPSPSNLAKLRQRLRRITIMVVELEGRYLT